MQEAERLREDVKMYKKKSNVLELETQDLSQQVQVATAMFQV